MEVETERAAMAESSSRAALDRDGYCVIPDVLSRRQTQELRDRVLTQAAAERAGGLDKHVYDDGASQRVWVLVNKGRVFTELVRHPSALEFARFLLGREPLLSSAQANVVGPGGAPMFIHPEQGFMPGPWPPYPMIASVIWLLDDFTVRNGATEVIAGSHHQTGFDPAAGVGTAVPVCAAAGSMMVMDGRLLHRSGVNRVPASLRCAIIVNYCQPFLRQQENYFLSATPEVAADESLRALLGYVPRNGYGLIKSPEHERERQVSREST